MGPSWQRLGPCSLLQVVFGRPQRLGHKTQPWMAATCCHACCTRPCAAHCQLLLSCRWGCWRSSHPAHKASCSPCHRSTLLCDGAAPLKRCTVLSPQLEIAPGLGYCYNYPCHFICLMICISFCRCPDGEGDKFAVALNLNLQRMRFFKVKLAAGGLGVTSESWG